MPIDRQEVRRWPALLIDRIAECADGVQVADAMAAGWLEIDRALHPIIGRRGVAALYHRSLHVASARHAWLGIRENGVPAAIDPTALKSALSRQPAAEALAGGTALLQCFDELLTSLVGASLTERLLRPVVAQPPGTSPAQDPSS